MMERPEERAVWPLEGENQEDRVPVTMTDGAVVGLLPRWWQTREGSVIDLMEVSERVRRGDPMARPLLDVITAAYAAIYNELEERLRAKLAAVLAAAEARDTARARQLIASFTPEEETELQTEIRRLAQHDSATAEWLVDL